MCYMSFHLNLLDHITLVTCSYSNRVAADGDVMQATQEHSRLKEKGTTRSENRPF
jgi:hypothetical protein